MKVIKGFQDYMIDEVGNVYSIKNMKYLKSWTTKNGYKQVRFSVDNKTYTKSVHRLVAEAFIPNPYDKSVVHHINEDKTDNRVENLMWVTNKENLNLGTRNERIGKKVRVYKNGIANIYKTVTEASQKLGINQGYLSQLARGDVDSIRGYTAEYV